MPVFIGGVQQGTGIGNVVEDTTPQLGGNLDANGSDITGVGHIGFLATQDPSAGANDLDDYEEGDWTPAIADDSLDGSGEGQTYSVQVGQYVKIGGRLFIDGRVLITSLGTLTTSQACRIVGLPFTVGGGTAGSMAFGECTSLAIPGNANISGQAQVGTTQISCFLWDSTAGVTNLLISELSAGGELHFSGAYDV